MRLLRLFLPAALLCGACSTTPAITVVATPAAVSGDGLTVITVTAKPTEGGSPVDTTVHFTLEVSGGVPDQPTFAAWDGAAGTPTKVDVTSSSGVATATVKAPRQGFGTMKFTVSFSSQGKEPTATTSVTLQPSGGAAASLSFTCEHQNIGARVQSRLKDVHVLCRATALDVSGHPIPHASVQTLSEAGTLNWAADASGVQEFVYTVRPDDAPPKDVGPLDSTGKEQDICPSSCADPFSAACQGEPCWTDPTGPTHNPRDSIATLIAAVPAQAGFDTQGEPFVDMNDNGVRDPGEPFIDYNGNGKYDGPAGVNQPHMVWRTFRMIWSGESAATATGVHGTTHDVFMTINKTDTTHATATLRLFDRFLNQLAADGSSNSDGVAWSYSCAQGGSILFGADDQIMEQHDPGVLFSADTGQISLPQSRSTWTRQTDYNNNITYTSGGTNPDECHISAAPHRAYDPGAIDFDPEGANPDVVVGGSVTF